MKFPLTLTKVDLLQDLFALGEVDYAKDWLCRVELTPSPSASQTLSHRPLLVGDIG